MPTSIARSGAKSGQEWRGGGGQPLRWPFLQHPGRSVIVAYIGKRSKRTNTDSPYPHEKPTLPSKQPMLSPPPGITNSKKSQSLSTDRPTSTICPPALNICTPSLPPAASSATSSAPLPHRPECRNIATHRRDASRFQANAHPPQVGNQSTLKDGPSLLVVASENRAAPLLPPWAGSTVRSRPGRGRRLRVHTGPRLSDM